VCREAVAEARAAAGDPTVLLSVHGDANGHWDGKRLGQLLSNLLANALQHGAAHAAVEVELDGDTDPLRLHISNHGEPIPRDVLPAIFDPLVRAGTHPRETSAGLGLGLYIAREIVHAHGGTLSVASGARTRFTVELPRSPP
jgi:phosphoserine phosphatase RsbU/P